MTRQSLYVGVSLVLAAAALAIKADRMTANAATRAQPRSSAAPASNVARVEQVIRSFVAKKQFMGTVPSHALSDTGSRAASTVRWRRTPFTESRRIMLSGVDLLDPLAAPWAGFEGIAEGPGLPRNLSISEFHNAHGEGRLIVIGKNVLRDP